MEIGEAGLAPAQRVFALLEGAWTVEREVNPGGRFVGKATFTRTAADALDYHEKGRLSLPNGKRLEADKRYTYLLREGLIEVRFADGASEGEHFISLQFPAFLDRRWPIESGEDTHLCRLDTYKASFRFEGEDHFAVTYVVSGPRKGYVSQSIYLREV